MFAISPTPLVLAGLILVGFATAFLALVFASGFVLRRSSKPSTGLPDELVFVFEDGVMVDSSPVGADFLALTDPSDSDLARVAHALRLRFAALESAIKDVRPDSPVNITSVDEKSNLELTLRNDRLRLNLTPLERGRDGLFAEEQLLAAAQDRLAESRAISANVPLPMWKENEAGKIIWANAEYFRLETLLDLRNSEEIAPKRIFNIKADVTRKSTQLQRDSLVVTGSAAKLWFEFHFTQAGDDRLVTAIPVDRVVRAESSLRDFVQTLTQTFAHLNVGLAVFGQGRELAIFNPAMSELLELPPEFLVNRPSLFEVFDRLREQRMMPERKNYHSWLAQISALEDAAADGTFSETWSLIDGRTYRVTGRPHPDGALAFLFEDISAEITLERGFRSDLQVGQAVINSLEEAIAVFTPAGQVTIWNQAFLTLWQFPDSEALADLSFVEASRKWQELCQPTPVWGDARDFAAILSERSNWTADVLTRSGKTLVCRFEALPGGCTLVGFSDPEIAKLSNAPLQPLTAIG